MPVVTRRQSKLKAASELKDTEQTAEKNHESLNKKRRGAESKLEVLAPRSLNTNNADMSDLPGTKATNANAKPASHALAEKTSEMRLSDDEDTVKPASLLHETAPPLSAGAVFHKPIASRSIKPPNEKLLKPLPERPIECTKLPDGPEPVLVEVEYPETEDLVPVDGNVELHLDDCICNLASAEWMTACSALLMFRRLIRYNTSECVSKLDVVVPHVLKAMRSLRSALAKTAIMTVRDLYLSASSEMVNHTDGGGLLKPNESVLAQLLLKAASNDKKFVIEEAERSLSTMSEMLPPAQLIQLVSKYTGHKNPKVRGKAAKVLASCVDKLSDCDLHLYGLGSLVKVVAPLINDNSPDARDAAKVMAVSLKRAFYNCVPSASQLMPEMDKEAGEQPKGTTKQEETAAAAAADDDDEQVLRSPWEIWCISELGHTQAAGILRITS